MMRKQEVYVIDNVEIIAMAQKMYNKRDILAFGENCEELSCLCPDFHDHGAFFFQQDIPASIFYEGGGPKGGYDGPEPNVFLGRESVTLGILGVVRCLLMRKLGREVDFHINSHTDRQLVVSVIENDDSCIADGTPTDTTAAN